MSNKNKLSRRDFLKVIKFVSIEAAAVGLIGYEYSTKWEMNQIEITNLTLQLPHLAPAFKGLRLVQISDFHLGQWMNKERLDHVIRMAEELAPEYFILTGDYLEYRPYNMPNETATYAENIDTIRSSFLRLSALCPTIAILGNHDHMINAGWVESSLSQAGVEVLRNSVKTIQRGASELYIAAVDDVRHGMDRLDQVMEALPEDGAAILLVHEPDFADVSAATGRFDLQISGHSHGGQIVLPIIGPPILPEMGRKYPSGLYYVNNMLLYTNRGIGVTTINARFNCRPEITLFTLEPA
jgi:predicted MPP superfamily phosphohydrolase